MDDREEVRARIRAAARVALFLDYDGTLVPIAATPGEAGPDAALVELLRALAARLPLAVVSGRTLASLREMLRGIEGLALAGTHGAEIATAEGEAIELCDRVELGRRLDALRRAAPALADRARGFLLEDKGVAIALHYRQADPDEGERRAADFERLAADPLFATIRGKKVIEVRPRGADKGAAVRALLGRLPGNPLPVYFGDDTTDEDAFRAIAPAGLSALVAREPRPTAARFRVDDPAAVREILEDLRERLA